MIRFLTNKVANDIELSISNTELNKQFSSEWLFDTNFYRHSKNKYSAFREYTGVLLSRLILQEVGSTTYFPYDYNYQCYDVLSFKATPKGILIFDGYLMPQSWSFDIVGLKDVNDDTKNSLKEVDEIVEVDKNLLCKELASDITEMSNILSQKL